MAATRPRVPGWHPDPEDPSSLRHWDGRRWGQERRPRPTWAPSPEAPAPAVPAVARGGGPRRWWWLAALGFLACALAVVTAPAWLGRGPDIPARSVADTGFTAAADEVCRKALPALKASRPESREDNGVDAAFARRIDRAADGLAEVTADLRALPVAAPDAAEVDGWLDDWDAYVEVGRGYADRVRAGDEHASNAVAPEGSRLSTAIFVFAKANGMPSCTL